MLTRLLRKLIATLLFAFCFAHSSVQAASLHDPDLHWNTLETPHFIIHYADGLEELAQHVASKGDRIHREVTDYFNWIPQQRTHVTLTDGFDLANGFANPLPYNQIVLFTTPPADINTLEDFDDWLELVLRHEYVHIVHLDKATGTPGKLRDAFGRTPTFFILFPLFPNLFLPNWFQEGIATHIETYEDIGVGRGQSNYFRALMRNEVANGIKSLDSINMLPLSWPQGNSWYLYGVYFFRFLQDTYGDEVIKMLINDYSRFPIFYLVNANADRVLGKDYHALWKEFEQYLLQEFGAEIQSQQRQGLHTGRALSHSGYGSGFSRVDGQGNVYFIEDDQMGPSKIKRRATDGSISVIAKEMDGWYFDLHDKKGIVAAQLEASKNVRRYFDLYHIDPQTGEETRLTHNGRYHMASWSPDGEKLIAIHHQAGRFALHLLDANGVKQQVLWQANKGDDMIIGSLDWSPKGDKLVASVWRRPLGWNLELFDLNSKQWQALTASSQIEAQAQFDASGDNIVFSADYSGIYNIYSLNLQSRQRQQLTRVLGGAFYPSLSADQQLYYSGLSSKGNDLYQLPADNLNSVQLTSVQLPATQSPTLAAEQKYFHHDYRPLDYMRPTWWMPSYSANDAESKLSIATSGEDPLAWHHYDLVAAYEFNNQLLSWQLQYRYDRLLPSFTIGSSRNYKFGQLAGGDTVLINSVDDIYAFMQWPYIKRQQVHSVLLGGEYEVEKEYWRSDIIPTFVDKEHDSELIASFIYNFRNTEKGAQAISQHSGLNTELRLERRLNEGREYQGKRGVLDQWFYSPPLEKTVLALRALGGLQSQSMDEFEFSNVTDLASTTIGKSTYRLRGYPSGLNYFSGNALNLATLEWRLPLAKVENGIMLPPVGLRRVYGKLFTDAGRIWQWRQTPPAFSKSVGAELHLETVIGFKLYVDVILGVAKGLDEFGENQGYISVQLPAF